MKLEIEFNNIFIFIVNMWPEKIRLGDSSNRNSTLYDIYDEIDSNLIHRKDEVLVRQMNSSIHIIVHGIAKQSDTIYISNISQDLVKTKFEERLAASLKRTDLDWRPSDYDLANYYFSVNKDTPTSAAP